MWLLIARAGAADWQQLPPAEFAEQPEVPARIDFAAFDEALMAAAIFHETNRVRQQLGLAPFRHLPKLDEAAGLEVAIGVVQGELVN